MNILILAAGANEQNLNDDGYPFYLTEFEGIPLIERLVKQFQSINHARLLFAIAETEIKRWRLDNIIPQLTSTGHIIPVKNKTAGAVCTAMLAIEYVDNNEPLIILNANDILHIDFLNVLNDFEQRKLDAGTIVFHSIHPRYSYVALDNQGLVTEAAEKNPISKHATAGFYWFAHGKTFITAGQSMIAKDCHLDGSFYVCPVFNEMILSQAKIGVYPIETHQYHPLKSMRQIMHYESVLETGN